MALSFDQLKAAFANRQKPTENSGFWDKFYPFYKMNYDQVTEIRFLPDLDEENPMGFLVENIYHELQVNGQKKRVACLRMYGESCPCCELSSQHYEQGNTSMGKKFWRKKDYIGQVLVVSSPFEYPIKPDENPVRLISISPKIYAKIEGAFTLNKLDANPVDLIQGYNFQIFKTKQGEYANYDQSDFARRASPVSEELLPRIQLYDLKKFRFVKVEREAMEAMIQADLTGAPAPAAKQDGPALKPGVSADAVMAALGQAQQVAAPASIPAPAPTQPAPVVQPATPAPAAAPTADGAPKKLTAQEVLAMIRNRPAAAGPEQK